MKVPSGGLGGRSLADLLDQLLVRQAVETVDGQV